MLFVTGDTHGKFDRFVDDTDIKEGDIVIVCGDFGVWHDNEREQKEFAKITNKPYTIAFVDGNHENFDRLNNEFEVVDFHGGKAHKIKDNIFHLMRGYVFDFYGKKFFCFGGASSHDIMHGILDPNDYRTNDEFLDVYNEYTAAGRLFRVRGVSWWDAELPSQEEMVRGRQSLEAVNYKVDYVITHCLPTDIQSIYSYGEFKSDILTDYLMEIKNKLDFTAWFCGHYHDFNVVEGKYQILYWHIIQLL